MEVVRGLRALVMAMVAMVACLCQCDACGTMFFFFRDVLGSAVRQRCTSAMGMAGIANR